LQGSPNLKRALSRAAAKDVSAKRAELEQLYADIKERRREALAAMKKEGRVVFVDKSNSRGAIYTVRIKNPELTIAENCERQLQSLARQLSHLPKPEDEKPASPMDAINAILARSHAESN
jgi:phage terminase small subunit